VRCGQEFPKPKTIPKIWGQPADPASDAPNINYDWQGGCLLTEGWGLGCLILVWIVIFGFMIVAYINFRSH